MKTRLISTVFLVFTLRTASAQTDEDTGPPDSTQKPPAAGTATADPFKPSLPGKGIAEHDFIFAGEDDVRRPMVKIFLVKGGKLDWTYKMLRVNSNGVNTAFSDIHRLSNGDMVFAYQAGWRKIDKEGKTIYDYRCPKAGQDAWCECHSAQPIGNDKVLFVQNGLPPRLILYNIATGQTEFDHPLRCKDDSDAEHIHSQFRCARMTKAGTFLVTHMDMSVVIEYDKNWNAIWTYKAPRVWQAVRLKNGNTLMSGNQNNYVREVNPQGETVWEISQNDLPNIQLNSIQQVMRLANGNTVFCNWVGRARRKDWTSIVQLVEVRPDKSVAWALNQWRNPDLGPATSIQILDEPGNDEDQDLMR